MSWRPPCKHTAEPSSFHVTHWYVELQAQIIQLVQFQNRGDPFKINSWVLDIDHHGDLIRCSFVYFHHLEKFHPNPSKRFSVIQDKQNVLPDAEMLAL